jgi:hypothetical protein
MTTLSCNQCRLLKNEAVVDILEQSLSDKNITAVFEIRENEVLVCTTCSFKTLQVATTTILSSAESSTYETSLN